MTQVKAVAFLHELMTGATRPCVFACEDADGNHAGEYVVKFRSTVRNGATGLLFEFVAAQLAIHLGLRVPAPAVVLLDEPLASATPDGALAKKIRDSQGLNFGCNFMPGMTTWKVDDSVPLSLVPQALEILAFDALIENVDRRREKPNLLCNGSEIVMIDHEMAFSFVLTIGGPILPFQPSALTFLNNHPLYSGLRKRTVSLDRFAGELESITAETMRSIFEKAPSDFGRNHEAAITERIVSASTRTGMLIDLIKRLLS